MKSLCAMLGTMGISPEAARLSLSRMARKGYFYTRKKGRSSYYFLTEQGFATISLAEGRSVFRRDTKTWDGKFRLISYEIPESRRDDRQKLTEALRCAGLGRAAAGLWAGAFDFPQDLRNLLDSPTYQELITEYQATLTSDKRAFARRIWNLSEISKQLTTFIVQYKTEMSDFRQGNTPMGEAKDSDCFRRYFVLLKDFIQVMTNIPPIPQELLGADWPAQEAHDVFVEYRKAVHDGTDAFIQRIYEPFEPEDNILDGGKS